MNTFQFAGILVGCCLIIIALLATEWIARYEDDIGISLGPYQ